MVLNESSENANDSDVIRCALEYAKNITQIDIVFSSGNHGIRSLGIEKFSLTGPKLDFLPQTMTTKMNGIKTEVSLTMNQNYWDLFLYLNFSKNPKKWLFRRFSVLPCHFKWSYLSHFFEICPEIFFGTSKHVIIAK